MTFERRDWININKEKEIIKIKLIYEKFKVKAFLEQNINYIEIN